MSAATFASPYEDGGERIDAILRFQDYASETHGHLVRTAELIADGDQAILGDLLLVVRFLWS